MLETNNKNDAAKMLDDDYKIHLWELRKLLEPEESRNSQTCIEFNDLCYSIRHDRKGTEKTILDNVTGHFEQGKVTMIIGPSGAGKTTLLKIISGKRLLDIKGTIIMNGVERNRDAFRKHMCYVPQQFDLLPYLTTRETFYIASRLKLDVNETEQAICSIVNDIAESFGLSNCLDTLANKLSGGERKRLSIGVEMIVTPSVLLLDEPTSGLDSAACNQLVNMLHDVARANCTVICAIHQPSSQMISHFDDIMVLNRGRCMYCGPKSEILNTYSIAGYTCPSFYNIAEFVLEVITEQGNGDLENLYKICRDEYEKLKLRVKANKNELKLLTDSKQKYETNNTYALTNRTIKEKTTWQQQKILFLRTLICIKRDITLTYLRLVTHFAFGLFFGGIFYNYGNDAENVNGNLSYLFCCPIFVYLLNAGLAVLMYPMEAAVFLQEHLNNWYSLKSYYSVKILTDLSIEILFVSSYVFPSYFMTGQLMEYDRILWTWIICLLCAMIGQTMGVLSGILFDVKIGIFMIAAGFVPSILFAGFLSEVEKMPIFLQPLSFMSQFRYAFEGLMQVMYLDRPNLLCSEIYCYLRSPRKILSLWGMPTMPFHVIMIVLVSWIVGLHVATYVALRWKIYNAKH